MSTLGPTLCYGGPECTLGNFSGFTVVILSQPFHLSFGQLCLALASIKVSVPAKAVMAASKSLALRSVIGTCSNDTSAASICLLHEVLEDKQPFNCTVSGTSTRPSAWEAASLGFGTQETLIHSQHSAHLVPGFAVKENFFICEENLLIFERSILLWAPHRSPEIVWHHSAFQKFIAKKEAYWHAKHKSQTDFAASRNDIYYIYRKERYSERV